MTLLNLGVKIFQDYNMFLTKDDENTDCATCKSKPTSKSYTRTKKKRHFAILNSHLRHPSEWIITGVFKLPKSVHHFLWKWLKIILKVTESLWCTCLKKVLNLGEHLILLWSNYLQVRKTAKTYFFFLLIINVLHLNLSSILHLINVKKK